MRKLKQIVLGFFLLAGLSMAVSAQKQNDQKKPPPKEPPPKVRPGENKPPPRESRPKKPGSEFAIIWRDEKTNIA